MSDIPTVTHPHGCPECDGTHLVRRARHWQQIEQPLDRIENFYGGPLGLRAVVSRDAPEDVIGEGVRGHTIRCVDCNFIGSVREFVTEIQAPASTKETT